MYMYQAQTGGGTAKAQGKYKFPQHSQLHDVILYTELLLSLVIDW